MNPVRGGEDYIVLRVGPNDLAVELTNKQQTRITFYNVRMDADGRVEYDYKTDALGEDWNNYIKYFSRYVLADVLHYMQSRLQT
jgi:hypothetical protein